VKSQNKLRELSDHLQDLIEQERESIARGLHDGIGQSLSMLRMKILKMNELDINPEQMENRRGIVETLEDTIRELKNISYNLKPRMLEEMGLGFAIKFLVDKIVTEAGIAGEVNVIGEEIRLEGKLEIYLYRIVQEAITNTIKYSNATNFSIQLMITHKFLRMIISDNGNGFDLEEVNSRNRRAQGMGLINIRERVESYHGHLKIDSSAENGTMIVIEIPLGKEATWQNRDQYVY
jgi:signal transduction histidine kinase